jgi:hypothetical protein
VPALCDMVMSQTMTMTKRQTMGIHPQIPKRMMTMTTSTMGTVVMVRQTTMTIYLVLRMGRALRMKLHSLGMQICSCKLFFVLPSRVAEVQFCPVLQGFC